MLYRSTDRLCRSGAPMENLCHSASFESDEKNAPSKSGTKHLVQGRLSLEALSRRQVRVGRPCFARMRPSTMVRDTRIMRFDPEPLHDAAPAAPCKALPDTLHRPVAGGYPRPHPRGAGKIRLRSERVSDAGLSA